MGRDFKVEEERGQGRGGKGEGHEQEEEKWGKEEGEERRSQGRKGAQRRAFSPVSF